MGKIIWILTHLRELNEHMPMITWTAMTIWDTVHKKKKSVFNSPLIPLRDTHYFALGRESMFGNWIKKKMHN